MILKGHRHAYGYYQGGGEREKIRVSASWVNEPDKWEWVNSAVLIPDQKQDVCFKEPHHLFKRWSCSCRYCCAEVEITVMMLQPTPWWEAAEPLNLSAATLQSCEALLCLPVQQMYISVLKYSSSSPSLHFWQGALCYLFIAFRCFVGMHRLYLRFSISFLEMPELDEVRERISYDTSRSADT